MYQVTLYENANDQLGTVIHTAGVDGAKVFSGQVSQGINQVDMFEFELTFENIGYSKIRPMQTLIEVYNTLNDYLEFSGRVIDYTDTMSNDGLHSKRVVCENELGYLHDSYQPYFDFAGMTRELFIQLINNHNAQVEPYKRYQVGNVSLDHNINERGSAKVHQFTWGDTLNQVAETHGISVDDLKEFNNIDDPNMLYPGDTIIIRKTETEYETGSTTNYRIVWGDTLSELAVKFKVPMQQLVNDNNIKNPDLIYAGNSLRVNTIAKKTRTETQRTRGETEIEIPLQVTPEESTFEAIHTHLIKEFGGELQIRNENGVRYIDYVDSIGHASAEDIRLSKNLMSVTKKNDATNVITRLKPLGSVIETENEWENQRRVTIESVNGGKDYLDHVALQSEFGIQAGSEVFEEENPSVVKSEGQKWLDNQRIVLQQFTVEALDLFAIGKGLETFSVGNTHNIINPVMALNERIRIIGKSIDIVDPVNSSLTIGDKFKTLIENQIEQRAAEKQVIKLQGQLRDLGKSNTNLRASLLSTNTEIEQIQADLTTVDIISLPIELQGIHNQISDLQMALQGRSSPLRVATFNIWQSRIDIEQYKNFALSNRLDIIGFQEILETTPEQLETYGLNNVKYEESWNNYGNAIQSRFDLSELEVFELPIAPTHSRRTLIKTSVEFEGKTISVYNTHLNAQEDDTVRLQQIEFIKQTMEADASKYKILTGDFNLQDKAHYDLLGDLKSAQGHDGVWHDTWDVTKTPWGTGAIDNILVTPNIDILKVEMPLDKMGSDHHMLWAEIALK